MSAQAEEWDEEEDMRRAIAQVEEFERKEKMQHNHVKQQKHTKQNKKVPMKQPHKQQRAQIQSTPSPSVVNPLNTKQTSASQPLPQKK